MTHQQSGFITTVCYNITTFLIKMAKKTAGIMSWRSNETDGWIQE